MTDPQFKKMNEWFKKLNQRVGEVKKDLSQRVGEVKSDVHSLHDKVDLKFERVYREIDSVKSRLTEVEEHLSKYTDDERNEIRVLRLALSKLEDRVSALSA